MLFLVLAVVVAFGTSLAWWRIFLRRDKFDAEPRRLLAMVFIAGCISTVPSAIVEYLIPSGTIVSLAVVAPAVEEWFKLTGVVVVCWPRRHFNQVVDGAIYGVSAGLGFAAVENLFYGLTGGFGVLGARVLVGPLTHPLFTGTSGLFLARAKFERRPVLAWQGLALAILLHAGWNLGPAIYIETGEILYAAVFVAVPAAYFVILRRFLRHLATPEVQRLRTALAVGAVPQPVDAARAQEPLVR